MATAKIALDWLRYNLGLGETPPGSNSNFITRWFGLDGQPWCAMTVSRALDEAWGNSDLWQVPGVKHDYPKGTAYTPDLLTAFEDAGLYDQEPSVGAVVIFGWPGTAPPLGDHTGLVESWVDNAGNQRTDAFVAADWDRTVVTLEGNHNDELVRMRRSMDVILGFGHPPYDPEPTPEKEPFMALSDADQKYLLDLAKSTNDALARIEIAIRDTVGGLGAKVDQLLSKP